MLQAEMVSPLAIRDIYEDGIDFAALARTDDDFAKVYQNGKLDLQDPQSLQQLTKSLLKRDFDIQLQLPDDRLCPPVPIRYAYIHFLSRLLSSTRPSYLPLDATTSIVGLDIGTGASSIYPLLGTATHPAWTFHGTDIDAHTLSFARTNLSLNPTLAARITLHTISSPSSPLLDLPALGITDDLDFAMCNPPFYDSADDMRRAAEAKLHPPSAVCTGGETEMIAPGGDAGFALRLLNESCELRSRIRWYTCMLGKLGSVRVVVDALRQAGCDNWAVGVLAAGARTRRWVLAWSWGPLRPAPELVRSHEVARELCAVSTAQYVPVDERDQAWIEQRLGEVLDPLDVRWTWDAVGSCGIVQAKQNTWSRSARRKKARLGGDADVKSTTDGNEQGSGTEGKEEAVALAVRITADDGLLDVRWLQGTDAVLFESFCGMLKRSMNQG